MKRQKRNGTRVREEREEELKTETTICIRCTPEWERKRKKAKGLEEGQMDEEKEDDEEVRQDAVRHEQKE